MVKPTVRIAAGLEQTIDELKPGVHPRNRLTARTAPWKGHWLPAGESRRENDPMADAYSR